MEDQDKTVKSKNILIVDDSATIRKLVGLTLKFKQYHVTTANDGKQAWDKLQKKNFDMVIIDILMPTMDGFQLLAKIKNDEKLKNVPSVLLTTEGDEANKQKGMELGADSFLVKPFQPQQLLAKVEEYVK